MAGEPLSDTNDDTEQDDLRASIEAAMSDSGSDGESSGSASAASQDPAPAAEAAHSDGRQRDEHGRFVPKDAADSPTADKAGAAPVAPSDAPATQSPASKDQSAQAAPSAPTPDAPPAGWTPEAKAEWTALSPALKAAVLKREAEISDGGRQWSEQRRRYEATLAPLAQETSRLGMTVEQGLQTLLSAHHALNRDAPTAIRALCQQYGVDPATLAGSSRAATESDGQVSQPDIDAMVRQAVASSIGPIIAPIQARFAAEDTERQNMTAREVEEFAASAPHFDAVSDDLQTIIPSVKAANPLWPASRVLKEAYDRAVFANPSTRQLMLDERDRTAEAARQQATKERAAKARTASSSITGAPPAMPRANGSTGSLRADIEAAFGDAG